MITEIEEIKMVFVPLSDDKDDTSSDVGSGVPPDLDDVDKKALDGNEDDPESLEDLKEQEEEGDADSYGMDDGRAEV